MSCEEYCTGVYYATIDVLLTELNDRFSELNLSLLRSLEALIPTSTQFLHVAAIKPFLIHYELSEASFISEAATAKTYLEEYGLNEYSSDSFHKIYHYLSQVSACLPIILRCYKIAMTMGVSRKKFLFSSENQDVSSFDNESGPSLKPCSPPYIERSIIQTLESFR